MRLIFDSDVTNALQANREKFGVLAMPIENVICNIISNLPTIDAEPVVYCKNCKYWQFTCKNEFDIEYGDCSFWTDNGRYSETQGEDFCSAGDRREEQ